MTDTGVGISEEDQKHLFRMFGKMKKSFEINQQGVGLGLMISKKLCEHLGGSITVSSKRGEGATFTFSVGIDTTRKHSTIPDVARNSILSNDYKYKTARPSYHRPLYE